MQRLRLETLGSGTIKLLLVLVAVAGFAHLPMLACECDAAACEIVLRPAVAVARGDGSTTIGFDVTSDSAGTIRDFAANVVAYDSGGRILGECMLRAETVYPGVANNAELSLDVGANRIASIRATLESVQDETGRDMNGCSLRLVTKN